MHEIIPGINDREWSDIEKKIELVKPFSKVIHIDLLDGKFADPTTFLDPKPFSKYSQDIFFELHMMVEEPESYLEAWGKAGFRRFIGHIEKMSDQESFVARAQDIGEVGLALDAGTDVSDIIVPLHDLDTVLVMTIKAGLSGQEFMPELLKKVELLNKDQLFPVEIDGGINDQTITAGVAAGVRRFASTSFIYWGGNPQDRFDQLVKACE